MHDLKFAIHQVKVYESLPKTTNPGIFHACCIEIRADKPGVAWALDSRDATVASSSVVPLQHLPKSSKQYLQQFSDQEAEYLNFNLQARPIGQLLRSMSSGFLLHMSVRVFLLNNKELIILFATLPHEHHIFASMQATPSLEAASMAAGALSASAPAGASSLEPDSEEQLQSPQNTFDDKEIDLSWISAWLDGGGMEAEDVDW